MSYLKQAVRLVDVMTDKGALREMWSSKYFSLASYKVNQALYSYQPIIKTIIDAGANQGQFALAAAHRFPMARIYSFEPVPDVFSQLQVNSRSVSQIQAFNYALGSITGQLSFYRNAYSHVSSALVIHHDNTNPNYDQQASKEIKVKVYTLDDLFPTLQIESPVLLKMDVQGFEKEVLLGSKSILSQIEYVLMEASFVPLYNKQPLFSELHSYMNTLGYDLVAPLDFNVGKQSKIIEMDVLYQRLSGINL